jgi:hypothetical protein
MQVPLSQQALAYGNASRGGPHKANGKRERSNMKKAFAVICLSCLLVGCISTKVTQPAANTADLGRFQSVKIVMKDSVATAYSRESMPIFAGMLTGKLQSLGFLVTDFTPQMVLAVEVHEFSPGNRALRTFVGFGAGEALLKYTATFTDEAGNVLAQLEGGKSYNGLELVDNPTFKSDESTRMGMISYSVSQIAQFIQGGGT